MEKLILMMKYVIQLLFQLITFTTYTFNIKIASVLFYNFLFIVCIKSMYALCNHLNQLKFQL